MRISFSILLILLIFISFGKTTSSSYTKQVVIDVKQALDNEESMVAHELLKKYPVYKVNGVYSLSVIVKISADFQKNKLPNPNWLTSQIGDIATLKIPLDKLDQIYQLPGVEELEVGIKIAPDLKKAIRDTRADSVHKGLGLAQAFSGKNVIIGVTDWGFDFTHPMFYDTSLNQTRILGAWDQFKTSGPAPTSMNYGTEYYGKTALAAQERDTASIYYDYATHGSHVAGIAGGGGAGIGLKGNAYDANFLFSSIVFESNALLDAVVWMKQKAAAEGKRLVVNMSIGLYFIGPLDGTSLLSQALDNLINQGVVIVTSAGNNGDDEFHILHDFSVNDTLITQVDFYPYSAHASMWGQSISAWGEVGERFLSQFQIYSGTNLMAETPFYNTMTSPTYIDSLLIVGVDTIFYNMTIDSAHPQNQKPHMRMRVKNENTSLKVVLKSYGNQSGKVHYINVVELSNGVGNWGMPFSKFAGIGTAGDNEYGIGEPACATQIITVAAHSSDIILGNGTVITGAMAAFSSIGPRQDGYLKIDLSAPGVAVESSISSFTTSSYTMSSSTIFNSKTYDFARYSGTSMASPAVAGVIALMLEANPNLTPAQVREILRETARTDNKTGVIPPGGSPSIGMGKVNAHAAVARALHLTGEEHIFPENNLKIYPNPVSETLFIFCDNCSENQLLIYDIHGKKVQESSNASKLDVSNLPIGTYVIKLHAKDGLFVSKFVKIHR